MLSSKHFLFINMLLFYIEDKNHFLKKINFNWMKDLSGTVRTGTYAHRPKAARV